MSNCNPSPCDCDATPATPNPAAEPLDSALQNFIDTAFGSVEKVVEDGQIVWQLPCDLDSGLAGNPRQEDEGLFCYILRLLDGEITGLQGLPGVDGEAGAPGENAFSELESEVELPDIGVVSINLPLVSAAWVAVGSHLFVAGLGWVRVEGVSGNTVAGTILTRLSAPSDPIPAGAAVIPAGARGPTGPSPFPPTAVLSMGGFRLIDVGTPTGAADAATKAYVDAAVAGTKLYYGAVNPIAGLGVTGDFYLNTATGAFFQKTAPATWSASLFLATGLSGGGALLSGVGAPAGVLGQIGDYYINNTNGAMYRKTAATTWTASPEFRAKTAQRLVADADAEMAGFALKQARRRVSTVSGDYHTIVSDDINARLVCTASTGVTTVTIEFPTAVFTDGAEVEIVQMGTDAVEIYTDPLDPGGAVTVHGRTAAAGPLYAANGQYAVITVRRVGTKLVVAGDYV